MAVFLRAKRELSLRKDEIQRAVNLKKSGEIKKWTHFSKGNLKKGKSSRSATPALEVRCPAAFRGLYFNTPESNNQVISRTPGEHDFILKRQKSKMIPVCWTWNTSKSSKTPDLEDCICRPLLSMVQGSRVVFTKTLILPLGITPNSR